MIYSYICQSCQQEYHIAKFSPIGGHMDMPCQSCGGLVVRRASFVFRRGMAPHYNEATGSYVSSNRQFKDELKRKSEEATIRTGMEHNFQPVDVTEAKALGVTDDGLEVTHRVRHNLGITPPSTSTVIYK